MKEAQSKSDSHQRGATGVQRPVIGMAVRGRYAPAAAVVAAATTAFAHCRRASKREEVDRSKRAAPRLPLLPMRGWSKIGVDGKARKQNEKTSHQTNQPECKVMAHLSFLLAPAAPAAARVFHSSRMAATVRSAGLGSEPTNFCSALDRELTINDDECTQVKV